MFRLFPHFYRSDQSPFSLRPLRSSTLRPLRLKKNFKDQQSYSGSKGAKEASKTIQILSVHHRSF